MVSTSDDTASSSSSGSSKPLATMHARSQHTEETCRQLLRDCEMFQKLPDHRLDLLARHMEYKIVNRNTVLLRQGEKSDRFFLLESGDVRRKKVDPQTGKVHNIEYAIKASSINSMKVIAGDPVVSLSWGYYSTSGSLILCTTMDILTFFFSLPLQNVPLRLVRSLR